METTFYTFSANEIAVAGTGVEQASGGDGRRVVCLRSRVSGDRRTEGKVISLDAWRAAHALEEAPEEDCLGQGPAEEAPAVRAPAQRPRRREARGAWLDWLASLALIAVAVSACVSFLL